MKPSFKSRDPVVYTGPLLKKGLEDYMNSVNRQYLTVKERNFEGNEDGPFITCHACGSIGPFKLVPAVNNSDMHLYEYADDATEKVISKITERRYNITIDPKGKLRFKDMGPTGFDLDEFRENIMITDSYLEEHIECLNCDNIMMFAYEQGLGMGMGVPIDEFECTGNLLLFSDEPTYIKTKKDEAGETEIVHQEITRQGVIDLCLDCYHFEDGFLSGYEEILKKITCVEDDSTVYPGAICDECIYHNDFRLFEIKPCEIMYCHENGINRENPGRINLVDILKEKNNDNTRRISEYANNRN